MPSVPKKTIGIPSIGSVKSKIATQEEEKKKEVIQTDIKETKVNSYTEQELATAWESFTELRRNLGNDQEVAFLKHTYVKAGDIIKIQIHNSILEVTFDKLKVELQAHLRGELQNDAIKIELEKLENASKKMLYTNKEKFNHLADKYPAIKLLQEKLSLDPDY